MHYTRGYLWIGAIMVNSNFLSADSVTKIIFSAGLASTNGTSINSNVDRLTELLKFRETVLLNQSESAESHHWVYGNCYCLSKATGPHP